ncbi:MAG TPA: DUF4838 domain-containing protein [Planctomycetota bacterium]|nr:DUF4838 domain-containing protein [Planctomycetota bacterium]HRR82507.1 DUF4838 domain-containing protein [Planctomycetota bacterium]HRT93602.1 DUF4838 domain-containing protein [Planctomycetota bacterium]
MRCFKLSATCLLAISAVAGQAMEIVRDGQPIATVVVEKAPAPDRGGRRDWDDAAAARVFVDWVKKITDAELPIAETAPAGKPAIFVGAAALKAGLKLDDIKSPTNEGMRLVCDGDRVLLAGQCGVATVKAVCRFLEELGCRYFMDKPLGEVFPRSRSLSVGTLDITDQPGFLYRTIWGSQWSGHSLWKVWNGAGGLSMGMGHSWGGYVRKNLFAQHPEYFPLRLDKRVESEWLCTSNPDLRKLFAENLLKAIEGGAANPSISPPDGTTYCECPACKAQDDPNSLEPSSGKVNMTNRYCDFFDFLGKQVAARHPESILSFYAYADYTQPPTRREKLPPNIAVWIAPIRYCRYHRIGHPGCPSRTQLAELLDGWAAVASRIGYRTYNFNLAECVVPFFMYSVWKHDIPWLKAKGCIGVNLESLENWEIYGPHMYLSIRLAYSPDADAAAIMDDYFARFYGPKAGPLMKQYWMAVDGAFDQMKAHAGSFFAIHLVYTPEFLARTKALLDQAAEAALKETANAPNPANPQSNSPDSRFAARVAIAFEGWRNAAEFIALRNAMNQGDFAQAKKLYDALHARNEAEYKKGYGNHYTLNYLERFVGAHVNAGAAATAPPAKVLAVLPDQWRLAYDRDELGPNKGYPQPDFDDSQWKTVATYSNTLDAQGLPDEKTILWYRTRFQVPEKHGRLALFFTEVDGNPIVYINGKETDPGKKRAPFEIDITKVARPGDNLVAVRVDHSKITELFLGGIIRPVLLIERP